MKRQTPLLVLLFLCLAPASVFSTELSFYTHSSKDQTLNDERHLRGKPHGGKRAFLVELVREMMLLRGVEPKIADVPFVRGRTYVQTKDNIAFFAIARTPEREDSVKWVNPLIQTSVYFYELKRAPTNIKSIEEAKSVESIGVLRGGIHEGTLRKLGFTNVYPVDSYSQVLSMLQLGRLTLIISSGDFSEYGVEQRSLNDFNSTGIKLTSYNTYLTFSKNVADNEVVKWQQAFELIKSSGKLEVLKNNYLLPPP